jgi:rSAM/selenodomain-associated transferase 2
MLLPELIDVDRPEDLPVWERIAGPLSEERHETKLSVIIPTLNEEKTIAAVIHALRHGGADEIIVVDGKSSDRTAAVARDQGARVLISEPGRAGQMNLGGHEASGDILLFLHADTRLPEGFSEHIRKTLTRPGVLGGAFELRIDSSARGLRIIESLANWRSRRMLMPYGDQAIFVKNESFREIGGFPDMPIMEDFEFIRRIKRLGTIAIVPAPVITSARRWSSLGVLRTTLINQAVIVAYHLGVSTDKLSRWYRRKRG